MKIDDIEFDSKETLSKMARSCGYSYAAVKLIANHKFYGCCLPGSSMLRCCFLSCNHLVDELNGDLILAGRWFVLDVCESNGQCYEDTFLEKMVQLSQLDGFEGFYVYNTNDNMMHEIWKPNETFAQVLIRLDLCDMQYGR